MGLFSSSTSTSKTYMLIAFIHGVLMAFWYALLIAFFFIIPYFDIKLGAKTAIFLFGGDVLMGIMFSVVLSAFPVLVYFVHSFDDKKSLPWYTMVAVWIGSFVNAGFAASYIPVKTGWSDTPTLVGFADHPGSAVVALVIVALTIGNIFLSNSIIQFFKEKLAPVDAQPQSGHFPGSRNDAVVRSITADTSSQTSQATG